MHNILKLITVSIFASLTMYAEAASICGVVKKTFPADTWVLTATPLYHMGAHNLNAMLPFAPVGTLVYTWNMDSQALNSPAQMTESGWSPDLVIPYGECYFVSASSTFDNWFIGEPYHGTVTTVIPAGHWAAVGIPTPIKGTIGEKLTGYTAQVDDQANPWDQQSQDFFTTAIVYQSSGWTGVNAGYVFDYSEGFFLAPSGTNTVTLSITY